MKAYDMVFQSGSVNADPPGWLLQFVWVAVAIVLLVSAALAALVLVRWLRLWRRSRGLFSGGWPLSLTPLDDLEHRNRYVRDREDPLPSLSTQEEIAYLDTSDTTSGGMLP